METLKVILGIFGLSIGFVVLSGAVILGIGVAVESFRGPKDKDPEKKK